MINQCRGSREILRQLSPSINVPPGSPRPGDRTPVTQARPQSRDTDKLEEKINALAAAISHWQSDLDSVASRSSRLEGAFTVLLTSLEGWKSDIREVASRTESRVLRGLEVIDSRISRVQPGGAHEGELMEAIVRLEKAVGERIGMLENDIASVGASSGSTAGYEALSRRLQSIEKKIPAPDAALAGRLAASFEILERRLNSIEQKVSSPGGIPANLAENLNTIENRLAEGQDRLSESQQALTRKLEVVRAETDATSANQLRHLAALQEAQTALAKRLDTLADKVSEPRDIEQLDRIIESQNAVADALAQAGAENQQKIAAGLAALEARLSESRTPWPPSWKQCWRG